jgi:hypothetical protein
LCDLKEALHAVSVSHREIHHNETVSFFYALFGDFLDVLFAVCLCRVDARPLADHGDRLDCSGPFDEPSCLVSLVTVEPKVAGINDRPSTCVEDVGCRPFERVTNRQSLYFKPSDTEPVLDDVVRSRFLRLLALEL